MEQKVLKSAFRQKKEATDLEVYNKFKELMEIPGAQILQVTQEVMTLFPEIHSPATVWAIRKRVENRLKNEPKAN